MADEEHVDLLNQGVDAWNMWRSDHPDVQPDLRGAVLAGRDLNSINLRCADLVGADLRKADLRQVDLRVADLRHANLYHASLGPSIYDFTVWRGRDEESAVTKYLDPDGSDLRGANLKNADLRFSNLTDANLTWASFVGANMKGVRLRDTIFANTYLAGAQGLDVCLHLGPCIIDYRTLQCSGTLPLKFLRGCGLPDNLIEYLPSLLNLPIQFYSCFISYSSQDDDFVQRLHADLQNSRVRCWFAPEDLKIGDKTRSRIDEVIRIHEKLLLVLSENSINSAWVEKEVETAFEHERETGDTVLFPVRLDDAVMDMKTGWAADIKRTRNIGDFRRWKEHDGYRASLARLLRDLKIEAPDPQGAAPSSA
jgi:uncharacterized protein YjbI with pentapeptide repeats